MLPAFGARPPWPAPSEPQNATQLELAHSAHAAKAELPFERRIFARPQRTVTRPRQSCHSSVAFLRASMHIWRPRARAGAARQHRSGRTTVGVDRPCAARLCRWRGRGGGGAHTLKRALLRPARSTREARAIVQHHGWPDQVCFTRTPLTRGRGSRCEVLLRMPVFFFSFNCPRLLQHAASLPARSAERLDRDTQTRASVAQS